MRSLTGECKPHFKVMPWCSVPHEVNCVTVLHFCSRFMLEQTEPNQPPLDTFFTVTPQTGSLMPHEKATAVQIFLKPKSELQLRDQPVLSCQV